MCELRHNTQQVVRIGVLLAKDRYHPTKPVLGGKLSWYWWKYLIKADGTVINIVNRAWQDVPNCDGLYYLTLTTNDTNIKGPLIIYIYDETSLGNPIYVKFSVIDKNVYDSKYSDKLLKVETEPQID